MKKQKCKGMALARPSKKKDIKQNVGADVSVCPSHETDNKNKGITLIALVITIIVLLILVGVTLKLVVGGDGILGKAVKATEITQKAQLEERINLAVLTARMGEDPSTIDLTVLEEELKDLTIEKKGTDGNLPWIVKQNGYAFKIEENGNVSEINGLSLNKTTLKLIEGKTQTITATSEGINGNITWSSSDPEVATVSNGNITAVGQSGQTAEITATIEGTDYHAKCSVKIVSKVISISVPDFEIATGEEKKVTVNTTPSENIEDLTYEYTTSDTSKAIIDNTGKITGLASGTVTITVTSKDGEGNSLNTTCTATIQKGVVSVTASQIATNPEMYYGEPVINYKNDGKVYRIFYVDTGNYFGDGTNTVYLKADILETGVNIAEKNGLEYTTKTLIRKMNPDWSINRENSENNWQVNEKAAAWLCDPELENNTINREWSDCFESSKAKYVIGSPSLEMYVRSYNNVSHTKGSGNYKIKYTDSPVSGYVFLSGGNAKDYTGVDSLDNVGYNKMYSDSDEWWLASPVSYYSEAICLARVSPDKGWVSNENYNISQKIAPLICLKPDFTIQIEK